MGWLSVIDLLSMGWLWAGNGVTMDWLLAIYYYILDGYRYQLAIYQVAIGWLLAGYWLAISWLLAQTDTLQDIVIYILSTKVAHGCYQYF